MSDPRRQIIDAAADLLQRHEPDVISGRQLAAEAGVTYSLIGHHFGGVTAALVAGFLDLRRQFGSQITSDPATWIETDVATRYGNAAINASHSDQFLETLRSRSVVTEFPAEAVAWANASNFRFTESLIRWVFAIAIETIDPGRIADIAVPDALPEMRAELVRLTGELRPVLARSVLGR